MCEGCANSSGGQRKVIHKPVASPHYSRAVSAQHFIIATAGHVDHGKSALVKALTGTDPDRLPEEKARGITIDLGFAHLELPAVPTQSVSGLSAATGNRGAEAPPTFLH